MKLHSCTHVYKLNFIISSVHTSIFLGTGKGKRKKGGKETPSGEKGDETESQKDDKPPTPEAAEPKGDEDGEGEGEGEGETEKAPKTVRIYYYISLVSYQDLR